jgi:hypothetical protein
MPNLRAMDLTRGLAKDYVAALGFGTPVLPELANRIAFSSIHTTSSTRRLAITHFGN